MSFLCFFNCLFCVLPWQEIDDCLIQAKDRSYDALVHFGKRGLNVAATAAVMAASKVKLQLRFHINISGLTDISSASTASSSPSVEGERWWGKGFSQYFV